MKTNNNPSVLYISSEAKEIINQIDENNYLGLSNSEISRLELFTFAMALGMDVDIKKDISKKESLIRASYLEGQDEEALLLSLFINNIDDKNNLEDCIKKDKIYDLAQKYANQGFDIINSMMCTKPDSIKVLEMIKDLDERYREIIDSKNIL